MRAVVVALVVACGKDAASPPPAPPPPPPPPAPAPAPPAPVEPVLATRSYSDLGVAIANIVPADARVIGVGELHSRTDRKQVRSSLAAFTAALPAFADKVSDLVVETWVVDKKCGSAATEATTRVEMTMRRPAETKTEIGALAEAARAAKIQPRAMRVSCADYATLAPPGKDVDPVALLTFTTKELRRVTTEALAKPNGNRPWIAVYGGALHNDRFPAKGVEDWSYAAAIDAATHDHFVEIDLIVPELADGDATSQAQPWYPLLANRKDLVVWQRGERSFVVILPRT